MSVALFVIYKSFNGINFANTHAVSVGAGGGGAMGPVEMGQLIAEPFLDNTGVLLDALSGAGILWSILEFERQMYSNVVRFERALLTDRRNYQPGPDNVQAFKSWRLNYSGATNFSTASSIEGGDRILSITRRTVGVGGQDGELEYRMMLNKEDSRAAGNRLLEFSSDQARITWGARLSDALADSNLAAYFQDGQQGTAYVVPRYTDRNNTTTDSSILGAYAVEGFTLYGPLSRQVRKGRKRKKPTTTNP